MKDLKELLRKRVNNTEKMIKEWKKVKLAFAKSEGQNKTIRKD